MTEERTAEHPSTDSHDAPLRLAILQCACKSYRRKLFLKLTNVPGFQVRIFIGEDIPGTKIFSDADFSGLDIVRLPVARLASMGRHILFHHKGLLKEMKRFKPDVILAGGWTKSMTYFKAQWYRRKHPSVGLVHWSLGGLPGVNHDPHSLRSRLKYAAQKNFDCFVTYSSFGKNYLVKLGHPAERIFVASNVSDTERHLRLAGEILESKSEARKKLGLPDKFTIIYAGNLEANKRLDQILLAAEALDRNRFNFVILGSKGQFEALRSFADKRGLSNVFMPGRVDKELALYYWASDVLVLPGRGGMVISEAMAYGLPVIVFQADGTEYDLVQDRKNGIILKKGDAKEIKEAIEYLYKMPDKARMWGAKGKQLIKTTFTTDNMVKQITRAIYEAQKKRTQ